MKYLTTTEVAEKCNLNIRTIQKWAKKGKIKGAKKVNRDWMIPFDADLLKNFSDEPQKLPPTIDSLYDPHSTQVMLPLTGAAFAPGESLSFILGIKDEPVRNIALAEYYYYRGDSALSLAQATPLLNSPNEAIRLSAQFICAFSSLRLDSIPSIESCFSKLEKTSALIVKAVLPQKSPHVCFWTASIKHFQVP